MIPSLPPVRIPEEFLTLLRAAVRDGRLVKLTLGKHRGADTTLQNVYVRPVTLKAGPHFAFVWRHATRDITKNFPADAALGQIEALLGTDFLDAHLFATDATAQLEMQPAGLSRMITKRKGACAVRPPAGAHDAAKRYLIPADAPWLRALGITNDHGQPREGMADKFRQIEKFAELLSHLLRDAKLAADAPAALEPIHIVDMGAGKGYLTFATAALLGAKATVRGIEQRAELVELCNRITREHGLANLSFGAGSIADAPLEHCDVLIALHACDTATDDALKRGIAAGARLLVVAPCCQKELRPQLLAPIVFAEPLRHGIFQERHAEFATDALRAMLLEWAGYRTRVFEFISTEHTAKNLMIAAIKTREPGAPDDERAQRIREFARFYGILAQALARQLGFDLASPA
jgi:SAM-dependent methyltransferase